MTTEKHKFKIVYLGSPDFAVPPLMKLLDEGYSVPLVITQPDRPRGRKHQLCPTAVKQAALEQGIPVLAVENANAPDVVAQVAAARPDLLVVAAFGQIMREELVGTAPLGAINIHGSLLPKYRGASPIQQALIDGETKTGVTIMYIAPRLDAGDMLGKAEVDILPEENTGTLRERLSLLGADLLVDVVEQLRNGTAKATPQDEALVTYAGKLTAELERVVWGKSAEAIHNLVRGLTPDTSAYTCFAEPGRDESQRLKIWQTALITDATDAAPGTVIAADKAGITVATGCGAIKLLTVQPPGKGQMKAADWWRGRRDLQAAGIKFEYI